MTSNHESPDTDTSRKPWQQSANSRDLLLWMDVETSGLDPDKHSLLEVEMRVTSMQADLYARQSWLLPLADGMLFSRWALETHASNGLLADMASADRSIEQISESMRGFLSVYGSWSLHPAGSSVHFDIAFLEAQLLQVTRLPGIHHQRMDLTSLRLAIEAIVPGSFHRMAEGLPETDHRAAHCLDRDIALYQRIVSHSMAAPSGKGRKWK
jgi:oligoribonuclease